MGPIMLLPEQHLFCKGHEKFSNFFELSCKKGRLGHAWLFIGPKGVGKRTLCYQLSRFILGNFSNIADMQENLNANNALFCQIAAQSHPDCIVLDALSVAPLTIEIFRKLKQRLAQHAFYGKVRAVILCNVDILNHYCINALLKIIEEPPEKTVFFLTAMHVSKVPPTLRSRCSQQLLSGMNFTDFCITLAELAPKIFGNKICKEKFSAQIMKEIYYYSQGCIGRALFFLDQNYEKTITVLQEELTECFYKQAGTVSSSIDFFSKNLNLFEEMLLLWGAKILKELSGKNLLKWEYFWVKIKQVLREAKIYNLDPKFTLHHVFALIRLMGSSF